LGCLLDSLAMILLTIPIVFPIVTALGYDPVWFGVIIVMVIELGLITPPIGMNVARDVPLETIFRGVTPFIVAQVILLLILIAFPRSPSGSPPPWARKPSPANGSIGLDGLARLRSGFGARLLRRFAPRNDTPFDVIASEAKQSHSDHAICPKRRL
jgi:hypothetical protein